MSPTLGYHPTYVSGSSPNTSLAGSFAPNGYGLYDMAGNMFEWCWDRYGSYSTASQTDPRGPASASARVVRGGSWFYYADYCRAANRNAYPPGEYDNGVGFRLARSSVP